MKVAVTGATGFLGRRLVAQCLEAKDSVRVLSRDKMQAAKDLPECGEIIEGDLASDECPLDLLLDGVDVLYHCAGELNNTSLMVSLHQDGTRRLAEAARGRISKWVQLSSVGVYGTSCNGSINEETTEDPAGLYEASKAESDRIVCEVLAGSDSDVVVLRPTIVYGADMPNRSLRRLISAVERGLFFFVGNGADSAANYIHVDDVVRAMHLCGSRAEASGGTFIIGNDVDMQKLVSAIAVATGAPEPEKSVPRVVAMAVALLLGWIPHVPLTVRNVRALTSKRWYSSDLIRRKLGYESEVSIEDGIAGLIKDRRDIS